jgi:branched-chain amino acid transport system permease protein
MPEIPVWVLDLGFFVTGQDLSRSRFTAYVGWLTLVVVFLLLANLGAGRTGRRWRAVRDDEVAAELAGIDLGRARVSAFVVSAAAAGAAGAILAFTVKLAAPSAFTLTLSLTLLAAIVLGGLGSLTGALIGAALLTFLPGVVTDLGRGAGLDDIQAAELAPLVYGLVMVAVILLAPAGIVGTLRGALARRRPTARATPRAAPRTGPRSDADGTPGGIPDTTHDTTHDSNQGTTSPKGTPA